MQEQGVPQMKEMTAPRSAEPPYKEPTMTTATASKPTTTTPRKPCQLGTWEVRGYRSIAGMGREGGAFTASVYKNGKRTLAVSNSGNGGGNDWVDLTVGGRHFGPNIDEFLTFAQKALEETGSEAHDQIIETMVWLASMEKAVAKNNWPRDRVIEVNITAHNEESHYKLSAREEAILRDPSILDSI